MGEKKNSTSQRWQRLIQSNLSHLKRSDRFKMWYFTLVTLAVLFAIWKSALSLKNMYILKLRYLMWRVSALCVRLLMLAEKKCLGSNGSAVRAEAALLLTMWLFLYKRIPALLQSLAEWINTESWGLTEAREKGNKLSNLNIHYNWPKTQRVSCLGLIGKGQAQWGPNYKDYV